MSITTSRDAHSHTHSNRTYHLWLYLQSVPAGFSSLCVAPALECQGDVCSDMIYDRLGNMVQMSGDEWCQCHEYKLEKLPLSVQTNLRTNRTMRIGFMSIFTYLGEAFRAKLAPTTANVLEFALSEWPPNTRKYLQRGDTVTAVVLTCFDIAIDQDRYLGDDWHEVFQKVIDMIVECRNDIFARQQYRKLEGISVHD